MLLQKKKNLNSQSYFGLLFLKPTCGVLRKNVFTDILFSLKEFQEEYAELKVWLFWLETSI